MLNGDVHPLAGEGTAGPDASAVQQVGDDRHDFIIGVDVDQSFLNQAQKGHYPRHWRQSPFDVHAPRVACGLCVFCLSHSPSCGSTFLLGSKCMTRAKRRRVVRAVACGRNTRRPGTAAGAPSFRCRRRIAFLAAGVLAAGCRAGAIVLLRRRCQPSATRPIAHWSFHCRAARPCLVRGSEGTSPLPPRTDATPAGAVLPRRCDPEGCSKRFRRPASAQNERDSEYLCGSRPQWGYDKAFLSNPASQRSPCSKWVKFPHSRSFCPSKALDVIGAIVVRVNASHASLGTRGDHDERTRAGFDPVADARRNA